MMRFFAFQISGTSIFGSKRIIRITASTQTTHLASWLREVFQNGAQMFQQRETKQRDKSTEQLRALTLMFVFQSWALRFVSKGREKTQQESHKNENTS
jgi:hypothetical protein